MKLVNNLIIVICIVSFLTSCSTQEDVIPETLDTEICDTGDEGDDIGSPEGFVIIDTIIIKANATGDEGDDIGSPDGFVENDSIIINTNATGDEGDDIDSPNI